MKTNNESNLSKVIFAVLAVMAMVGIGVLVYLRMYAQKATVENLNITNLSSNSATVIWTTDLESEGVVRVMKGEEEVGVFYDDRDVEQNEKDELILNEQGVQNYKAHHVTIPDLDPETEYTFKIENKNGSEHEYAEGSNDLKFTTNTVVDRISTPSPVYGRLVKPDGGAIADVVVVIELVGDEGKLLSEMTSTIAADNGTYSMDVSNVKALTTNTIVAEQDIRYEQISILTSEGYDYEVFLAPADADMPVADIILEKTDTTDTTEEPTPEVTEKGGKGNVIMSIAAKTGKTNGIYGPISASQITCRRLSDMQNLTDHMPCCMDASVDRSYKVRFCDFGNQNDCSDANGRCPGACLDAFTNGHIGYCGTQVGCNINNAQEIDLDTNVMKPADTSTLDSARKAQFNQQCQSSGGSSNTNTPTPQNNTTTSTTTPTPTAQNNSGSSTQSSSTNTSTLNVCKIYKKENDCAIEGCIWSKAYKKCTDKIIVEKAQTPSSNTPQSNNSTTPAPNSSSTVSITPAPSVAKCGDIKEKGKCIGNCKWQDEPNRPEIGVCLDRTTSSTTNNNNATQNCSSQNNNKIDCLAQGCQYNDTTRKCTESSSATTASTSTSTANPQASVVCFQIGAKGCSNGCEWVDAGNGNGMCQIIDSNPNPNGQTNPTLPVGQAQGCGTYRTREDCPLDSCQFVENRCRPKPNVLPVDENNFATPPIGCSQYGQAVAVPDTNNINVVSLDTRIVPNTNTGTHMCICQVGYVFDPIGKLCELASTAATIQTNIPLRSEVELECKYNLKVGNNFSMAGLVPNTQNCTADSLTNSIQLLGGTNVIDLEKTTIDMNRYKNKIINLVLSDKTIDSTNHIYSKALLFAYQGDEKKRDFIEINSGNNTQKYKIIWDRVFAQNIFDSSDRFKKFVQYVSRDRNTRAELYNIVLELDTANITVTVGGDKIFNGTFDELKNYIPSSNQNKLMQNPRSGFLDTSYAQSDESDVNGLLQKGKYEIQTNDFGKLDIVVTQDSFLTFYIDTNQNGTFDEGEPRVYNTESNPFVTSFKKTAEVETYRVENGWNLMSFPFLFDGSGSDEVAKASDLLKLLRERGITATHVTTYRANKFLIYSERENGEEVQSYSQDFKILPGEGYFVRVFTPATFTVTGKKVEGVLETPIQAGGWNLIGIYHEQKPTISGFEVLDQMNKQGVQANTLSRWQDGLYTNIVKNNGTNYGNDFLVTQYSGYWVKVDGQGSTKYKPE